MISTSRDAESLYPRQVKPWAGRSMGKIGLALLALASASAPRSARAEGSDPSPLPPQSRAEFFMYGRMGLGWTHTGQIGAGRYMNLGDRRAIGGRMEEGDYLEPGLRFHILKAEKEDDPMVTLVLDVEVFSDDGAILSDLANGTINQLHIAPEQAYLQAQNLFTKGLTLWTGARLYRKDAIFAADYFYFDNLPSQGIGVMYKGLDAAILVNSGASPFFNADLNAGQPAPATPEIVKRMRTMLVAGYSFPFGPGSTYIKGLAEFHHVPKSRNAERDAPPNVNPADIGWGFGAKLHLDFGNDQFNDFSVRYGGGIANGTASGRSSYDTFGEPGPDGTYRGALGVEVVDHFLWNVGSIFSLNGYATFHYDQGSTRYAPADPATAVPNQRTDFAFGLRPVVYLHKNFQIHVEGSYQLRKDEGRAMGSAVKLTLAPTIVPTGKPGFWTRPHIRGIYTLGLYNQAAVDQRMSPYLQTVGATRVAHFMGARAEWWFY